MALNIFGEPLDAHHMSLRPPVLGVSVALMALGAPLALVSMGRQIRRPRAVDWLTLFALVFTIAATALTLDTAALEVHEFDLPVTLLTQTGWIKKIYALQPCLALAIFLVKAAILALYLHVFAVKRWFKAAAAVGLALDAGAYLPALGLTAHFCAPAPGEPWGIIVLLRCAAPEMAAWFVTNAALGVLLDVYLFVLPVPLVLRLGMPARRKAGVLAVFGTALLGIVASILTLVYRVRLQRSGGDTWDGGVVILCGVAECWIGVIVVSMPGFASACKALARRVRAGSATSSGAWPGQGWTALETGSGSTSSAGGEKAGSVRRLALPERGLYIGRNLSEEMGLQLAIPKPLVTTDVSVEHEVV